jgi:8-oxo-dGTP pyrophosphatase MutT (NUDIX family)
MFAIDQSRARGHDLREEAGALGANKILSATQHASKACPVVFRDSSMREILAFEHPTDGKQLVKGRIEAGEDARAAALRELQEEAGIPDASIARDLGTWSSDHDGQVWSLHLCAYQPDLPETWTHHCLDDGGHDLKFFWHPVHSPADHGWAPQFQEALAEIRERTRALRWRG